MAGKDTHIKVPDTLCIGGQKDKRHGLVLKKPRGRQNHFVIQTIHILKEVSMSSVGMSCLEEVGGKKTIQVGI